MWQKLTRISKKYGIKSEVLSFVPTDKNIEIMYVTLENTSAESIKFTPVAAIPLYGRSADNIRDHRHVTSLLHRISTQEYGIEVSPVLSFDERGHQKNSTTYFVYGSKEDGTKPETFYPTNEMFIGEGGSFLNPEAVRTVKEGVKAGAKIQGKEAVGASAFESVELKAGEKTGYIVVTGITDDVLEIEKTTVLYRTKEAVLECFENTKRHWVEKVNIDFEMNDDSVDNYLKWICFQPILRRIYGCSFLPYHDYGKGGRGWRDLWQDCLALLVMEPDMVRKMIVSNYGGVRIDGTNATIIGNGQGEFIADRNNITRVWMDHAYWPFVTTKLYIDQTGDLDIFLDKVSYFKDRQSLRGMAHDDDWKIEYGNTQKTVCGADYFGTVIEHILLQNLCAFYDVGEHNEMRLHGADWNDALDMAWEKGESVAFTFIMAILVMPTQVTAMGFLRLVTNMGMYDSWAPLIVPSIASPAVFYFMYSYLQSSLPISLVEAARIDGSGEFRTFNKIVIPIMKPAIAVQAIFTFVGSWNNYFVPALVIQSKQKMTVPILIATLRGADYMNFDMGKIYMMITVAIVPIVVVYLLLSRFIISGVTLGGVKE